MTPEKLREHHEFYRRRLIATPASEGAGWGTIFGLGMMVCLAALNQELVAFANPTPEQEAMKRPGVYWVGKGWPNPTKDAPMELWPPDQAAMYGLKFWRRTQNPRQGEDA